MHFVGSDLHVVAQVAGDQRGQFAGVSDVAAEGDESLFVAGLAGVFGGCDLRFHRRHVIALRAEHPKGKRHHF